VCWWHVKLCDPLVTHGPYLSAFETGHNKVLYKVGGVVALSVEYRTRDQEVRVSAGHVYGQTMKEVTASRNVSAEKRFKSGTDSLINFKIGERYPSVEQHVVHVQGH